MLSNQKVVFFGEGACLQKTEVYPYILALSLYQSSVIATCFYKLKASLYFLFFDKKVLGIFFYTFWFLLFCFVLFCIVLFSQLLLVTITVVFYLPSIHIFLFILFFVVFLNLQTSVLSKSVSLHLQLYTYNRGFTFIDFF